MSLLENEANAFANDPAVYFRDSYLAMHMIPREKLEKLQLAALRLRFSELKTKIRAVEKLSQKLSITDISTIDDVVPLLFPHTIYKSYPADFLQQGRFDKITKWFANITAVNLNENEFKACNSIDDWLSQLEQRSGIFALCSSGTTGAMSFVPRSANEWDATVRSSRASVFYFADPSERLNPGSDFFKIIWPHHKLGRNGLLRSVPMQIKHIAGSEANFFALHEGQLSADTMYFNSRMAAKATHGLNLGAKVVPFSALAENGDKTKAEREKANFAAFFRRALDLIGNTRVFANGTTNMHYHMAYEGLSREKRAVFGPGSVVSAGGGDKGVRLPHNWEECITLFTGVPRLMHTYAMSEVMATHRRCKHNRFHIQPTAILFVLDESMSKALPRSGRRTGRAAFFDLMAGISWGGIITGDKVTVNWDYCSCGLLSPTLEGRISRLSEDQGGSDKISCAATDSFHEQGA